MFVVSMGLEDELTAVADYLKIDNIERDNRSFHCAIKLVAKIYLGPEGELHPDTAKG